MPSDGLISGLTESLPDMAVICLGLSALGRYWVGKLSGVPVGHRDTPLAMPLHVGSDRKSAISLAVGGVTPSDLFPPAFVAITNAADAYAVWPGSTFLGVFFSR